MPLTCFRVDASVTTGTGHLMECLALADSLGRTFSSESLFLVNGFEPALRLLDEQGYRYRLVPRGLSDADEQEWISRILGEKGAGLLACNLLDRGESFYAGLRRRGARLMVILDDAIPRRLPGDIVVNWSILQDEAYYAQFAGDGTRYCIGPRFMPMREGLHEQWLSPREIPDRVRSIFVNQGGSDPFGLTARILRGLELLDLPQEIVVVVGNAVPEGHREELRALGEGARNSYSFAWGVPPREMYDIMERSDLAVTAAGNTLYELALFGVPSLIVCHHERHQAVAEGFAARGAAVNLGIGTGLPPEAIARATRDLLGDRAGRQALSERMKGITDGLGCRRIAEAVAGTW
jgi:UDP-2,4-diacetamido-2,4,6-trideoxy-beta-L-altropyranose hydrolase